MSADHALDIGALTDRQMEIVQAARRILEAEGPTAVTMRRVAAELGIRAPSLYKHLSDKGVIEGLLQHQAMIEFGEAVGGSGGDPRSVAAAYRAWALANPHLYELAARRPVRRDIVGASEAFAAEPLVRAMDGDPDKARAFFGVAHGLVDLELNNHFPPDADIEATWHVAVDALAASAPAAPPRRRRSTAETTVGAQSRSSKRQTGPTPR